MKLEKFETFRPTIETYTKRVKLIGENLLPELYADKKADASIKIESNAFSTYQVFNRLPNASFIPKCVSNRLHASRLKMPVTVISPESNIKTFSSRRKLNKEPIQKGSLYFNRPKFDQQYQILLYEGKILSVRQLFEGKAVHLNINRFPKMQKFQKVSNLINEALKTKITRFRLGTFNESIVLLGMEDFNLHIPELTNLYFEVYESHVGHMPVWFKHHIESTMVTPFLYEYIDRDVFSKKCPYIL